MWTSRIGWEPMAAVQVSRLQIQEVRNAAQFRRAAMDSLARELRAHLPNGWGRPTYVDPATVSADLWKHLSAHQPQGSEQESQDRIEFQLAGAYSFWVTLLSSHDPKCKPRADAVWEAIKRSNPPIGWKPSGPDDAYIVAAFTRGWPEDMRTQVP